jgi:L-threonylcarbamoyladenylate synthase
MKVIQTESLSDQDFALILTVLRTGGVIGFPTDTAYGLGADAFNIDAVSEIFKLKGREESKPILLLVNSLEMTAGVSRPGPLFEKVAAAFWPGPLTLVLPADARVPETVTAGTGTVGVRWPVASFATALVARFGGPVTATSANVSGRPSCITAAEVRAQLDDQLALLIDGGQLPARTGSTILDLTSDPPLLLREGPISFDALSTFLNGNIRRTGS